MLYIIRLITSRRIRWAGHVAGMGERVQGYELYVGKPKRKNRLENLGVDGSKISK
jgi:hypothetical protein